MERFKRYGAELGLIGATFVIGALGFWSTYLGPSADPQPHHHLHIATTYLWLGLLLAQLFLLARGRASQHRRLGLAVLAAGPLLVASAALLTVHSAQRAIASGEPDFLIVQNVVGTVWLALVLFLAFALKRRRKLHGALLMSTLVLFLGPALFFALLAFAPPFRIEGPETFYRFQTAAMTGQAIIAVVVLTMFLRDRRSNWPYLLAGGSYVAAEAIKAILTPMGLIDPLTRLVATPSETAAFLVTMVLVVILLARSVWPSGEGNWKRADRFARPGDPAA